MVQMMSVALERAMEKVTLLLLLLQQLLIGLDFVATVMITSKTCFAISLTLLVQIFLVKKILLDKAAPIPKTSTTA